MGDASLHLVSVDVYWLDDDNQVVDTAFAPVVGAEYLRPGEESEPGLWGITDRPDARSCNAEVNQYGIVRPVTYDGRSRQRAVQEEVDGQL